MRLIAFLRPTNKYGTKGEYSAFRKLLTSEGFVLVQPEVFVSAVKNRRAVSRLVEHLRISAPSTGSVCILTLTDRQYSTMDYLVGSAPCQDSIVGNNTHIDL